MCMWLPGQLISIRRMCRVGFKYPGHCDFFLNRKKCYILTFVLFLCHYSPDSPHLQSVVSNAGPGKSSITPLVRCTRHMCPIRVHWHVKLNYKEYWRVKVTVTNFNYGMNYSDWNLVVQHPNFDNLTQLFSFNYKAITPYGSISKCDLSRTCNLTDIKYWWLFNLIE